MPGRLRPFEPALMALHRIGDAFLAAGFFLFLAVAYQMYVPDYISAALLIFFLTTLLFQSAGFYKSWRVASLRHEIQQILVGCFFVYVALFATGYFLKVSQVFSRRVIITWIIALPLLLAVERCCIRSFLRHFRNKGRNLRRVVIAGATDLSARLIGAVKANPWFGMEVICFFDDRAAGNVCGYPVIGRLESLPAYVRNHAVDIVYIALPMRAEDKIQMLMKDLSDSTATVNLVPDIFFYELLLGGSMSFVEDIPVFGLRESPLSGVNAFLKRMEDLVMAALILLLAAPVMLAVATVIKFTSRGPVFFRQWRYGLNGQIIQVYKFRTMTVCEDGFAFRQAVRCDPRVTPFGAFLRRFSIDELPQFINVLQGRMSIVGPRPHPVAMNEEYRKLVSGYMLRHKVKPGITGLAQVNGWRGETDSLDKMEMRVRYDLEYLQKWSMLLDLRIIAQTIWNNAWRSNAY